MLHANRTLKRFPLFILAVLFLAGLSHSSARSETEREAASSPNGIRPLLIGDTVPDVSLSTVEGRSISLRSLTQQKSTVLIFYRGGW